MQKEKKKRDVNREKIATYRLPQSLLIIYCTVFLCLSLKSSLKIYVYP